MIPYNAFSKGIKRILDIASYVYKTHNQMDTDYFIVSVWYPEFFPEVLAARMNINHFFLLMFLIG